MSKNIKLIRPTLDFEQAIINYCNEFLNPVEGIPGTSMLVSFEKIEDWWSYWLFCCFF